jgi:hypothetical protein
MINIDDFSKSTQVIYGESCIIRPDNGTIVERIVDAFKVISGKYTAVDFTEDINIKPIIEVKLYEVLYMNVEFNKFNKIPESIQTVLITKLQRELGKIGVSFDDGSGIKINQYTIDYTKRNLTVKHGDIEIDVNDNKELGKFFETIKFKYIFDKIKTTFEEIELSKDYMIRNK